MGRRGPSPLPTEIKILRGNPGHRSLNQDEPQAEAGRPRMPEIVATDAEAKREWKRTCDALDKMGLLTTTDRAALAAYCMCWSRWVDAENHLRTHGVVVAGKQGPKMSSYVPVAREAMTQMVRLLQEFGLTPSSRSRLKTTKVKDADEFETWEKRSTREAK